MQDGLPLVALHPPEAVLAWRESGLPVTRAEFVGQALALAARLPPRRHALNLCEGRYGFTLGLAAALLRGQVSLLPPNRSEEGVREILRSYPDSHVLCDQSAAFPGAGSLRIGDEPADATGQLPLIPAAQLAALVFTSGSTGQPQPNAKTWGSLVCSAGLARDRFLAGFGRPASLVVTVPPQHMYGLETSVLFALQAGVAVHAGRPFFPEDVRDALAAVPEPRVLVTTPVHLRACVLAGVALPPLACIISATAPLATELAAAAEQRYAAPVREIYGCTEAGSLASRRTVEGEAWQLYPQMSLAVARGVARLSGPQLPEPVLLQDVIELLGDGRFALRGRNSDMVNIAGKRASLGDLNHRLLQIEGVQDGVVFLPETESGPVERLAALVVAPGCSRERILQALRRGVDPVFLPRPLCLVDRLPRNDTGKLPRQALLELLRQQGGTA